MVITKEVKYYLQLKRMIKIETIIQTLEVLLQKNLKSSK